MPQSDARITDRKTSAGSDYEPADQSRRNARDPAPGVAREQQRRSVPVMFGRQERHCDDPVATGHRLQQRGGREPVQQDRQPSVMRRAVTAERINVAGYPRQAKMAEQTVRERSEGLFQQVRLPA